MKRENNDGQVIPARCYCYTFANQLVRTNVATNLRIYIIGMTTRQSINKSIDKTGFIFC